MDKSSNCTYYEIKSSQTDIVGDYARTREEAEAILQEFIQDGQKGAFIIEFCTKNRQK